jgi:hypothetical protein
VESFDFRLFPRPFGLLLNRPHADWIGGSALAGVYEGGHVEQQYLPEQRRCYEPTDRGYEAEIRKRMENLRGGGGQQ